MLLFMVYTLMTSFSVMALLHSMPRNGRGLGGHNALLEKFFKKRYS